MAYFVKNVENFPYFCEVPRIVEFTKVEERNRILFNGYRISVLTTYRLIPGTLAFRS